MKKSKLRHTLAREIKKLAQTDDDLAQIIALEIAQFGRRLTPIEHKVKDYRNCRNSLKRVAEGRCEHVTKVALCLAHGKTRMLIWPGWTESELEHHKNDLCKQFMAAVDADDFQKIHEIAEAVRFIKAKGYTDLERMALLFLKKEMVGNEQMTIRAVAEFVSYFKNSVPDDTDDYPKVETPADGFSALRKKCRELDFPLAPAKRNPARPVKSK